MPQFKNVRFKTKLYLGYVGVLTLLVMLTTMVYFKLHYEQLNNINLEDKGTQNNEIFEIKVIVTKWHDVAITPEINSLLNQTFNL